MVAMTHGWTGGPMDRWFISGRFARLFHVFAAETFCFVFRLLLFTRKGGISRLRKQSSSACSKKEGR